MVNEWEKIFSELRNLPKCPKKWNINKDSITSYDIFLESLGDYADMFLDRNKIIELSKLPNWSSGTKGTPQHYSMFFPENIELRELCAFMKGNQLHEL